MTEPKVTGLRSIDYNVTDVATSARFYENCWGLAPVAQEAGGQYLRATGAEHHIVVLHENPTAGVKCINFGADSRAAVDGLHTKLSGFGAAIGSAPAFFSKPGGGYGFAFSDPDGQSYTISSDVIQHGDAKMVEDRPFKLSHVVLNSDKVASQEEFYCDVLGFKVSDRTARMNFIRCSADHHSVAFAHANGPSLNHTAFEVPTFDALMRGSGRMKGKGFEVGWGVGRHGPGNNIFTYFLDPNGLVVEYTAEVEQVDDTYATGGPEDWAKRVGGPDRWGFAGLPTPLMQKAMGGDPQPPGVNVE
ncbi:MAG: VOC family protein [Proteobacteria bacterium]|nr:VOC family protein [Pseudomonadota bacterium]